MLKLQLCRISAAFSGCHFSHSDIVQAVSHLALPLIELTSLLAPLAEGTEEVVVQPQAGWTFPLVLPNVSALSQDTQLEIQPVHAPQVTKQFGLKSIPVNFSILDPLLESLENQFIMYHKFTMVQPHSGCKQGFSHFSVFSSVGFSTTWRGIFFHCEDFEILCLPGRSSVKI